MNSEYGEIAIKKSRAWIAGAALSGAATLIVGFAAVFGAFTGFAALGAATMAAFALLALFCGAQGASLRASARKMGWLPADELDSSAVLAKNEYLMKQLQAETARPSSAPTANQTDIEPDKATAQPTLAEEEPEPAQDKQPRETVEIFEAVREIEQELEENAEDVAAILAEADRIASFDSHGETQEDNDLIAEAEALLAQAAAQMPADQIEHASASEQPAATSFETIEEALPEKANKPEAVIEEEEIEGDTPTARSRQIAKKRIETVDRMLARTEDIFATARDLANHPAQDKALAALPAMLKDNPCLNAEGMPKVKPVKLSRNNRHWMGVANATASQEVFDALLSLEATFNINQDILFMLGENPEFAKQTDARKQAVRMLKRTSSITPDYSFKTDYVANAYPDMNPDEVIGEWALRCKIANAVENASLPFRITFDMMTNAAEGLVFISLEIPRPECFYFAATEQKEREALARDYALRSSIFMARVALNASPAANPVRRAIVCCHPHKEPRTLMSMDATREVLPKIEALTSFLAPMPIPVGYPAIRMSCEHDWLDPVTPHLLPTDDSLNPMRYVTLPETSNAPCYPRLEAATGAKMESDLGTREEAPMEQAWVSLQDLGDTAESAVAVIKELRDSSDHPSVKAGCDRLMRALVDGTANPDQKEQLATVFMGGGKLPGIIAFGMQAFASKSQEDVSRTVNMLLEELSPELQISMMDDTETSFRYFHNIAERIHYNLHSNDQRRIELVPRSYYAANEMAVYLLCQEERAQEAEPYAKELLRIAPLSSSSAVTMARVLERQERVLEAIDLVNQALLNASTVHDAALCYYRMAYLQWRAGREDLANAAYRLTVALRTDVSKQAQQELDELLESNKDLAQLTPSGACRVLDSAGLNIWDLEGFRSRMAQAAVLCADQTLYSAAAQLTLGLLEFQNDDALTDVYRSFGI